MMVLLGHSQFCLEEELGGPPEELRVSKSVVERDASGGSFLAVTCGNGHILPHQNLYGKIVAGALPLPV